MVAGPITISPDFVAPLLNFGAIGCVLTWFMLRNEVLQNKQTEAIDRLTRAVSLSLLAQEVTPRMTQELHELLKEVEIAESERRKGKR
jgi:hypothetical protein